ncbi:MAG: hypothetical protein IJ600_10700 [Lachnospiraceae bacterium]|nr:hypothetical protein [Lachnospiraceae bacterium]
MAEEQILFHEPKAQQFRDADADGAVGIRGYLGYFQDAVGTYMHRLRLGNDTAHEDYGLAWMYTKYRMQAFEKVLYDEPLDVECWAEPAKHSVAVHHAVEMRYQGRLVAQGRLESCLVDMESKRIARLERIRFPMEAALVRENATAPFSRIPQDTEGMEERYLYTVHYTDLDNNRHMNNQRYIPLLLDAFTPEEHEGHMVKDLEIHYRSQCFYGENLRILRCRDEDGWRVLVVKEDGTAAVCSRLYFA